MVDQIRQFAELLSRLQPEVRRGFMASVVDLQANVDWPALLEGLDQRNIEAAINSLHIDPAAYQAYSSVMTDVYVRSAASTIAVIKGQGVGDVGIRFNLANEIAQQWIRENVADRVVGFSEDQKQAARTIISTGYGQGQHPHSIATDLAGRVSRYGQGREGGILGLDNPRAERYHAVAQGMRTTEGVRNLVIRSADGTLSVRYKVNPATEKRILKAYIAGTAVPEKDRIVSENQYKNALLKQRADTIAATETANGVLGGRDGQWRQLVASGEIAAEDIVKQWEHGRGRAEHYRVQHYIMNGKKVQGLDTTFEFPDGTRKMHAHDPGGGARHNINCGCNTTYYVRQVL